MVSRRSDDPVVSRFANGARVLFEAWRALLTDALSASTRLARRVGAISRGSLSPIARVPGLLARSPGRGCEPFDRADARVAASCGALALLGGAVAAAGLGLWQSRTPGELAAVIVVVLWAPGRLLVMRVAAEPGSDVERVAVTAAWGLGLLPFGLALWPATRAMAWVASAVIVHRAIRCGFDTRDSRWIWAWTFGIELVALLAVWLLRNLHVAALLFGGG
ncbi:MAG: hypothetical protein Q8K99_03180 [Actinomycetota bacterium]|nr:hypothetical protein [Actinomycetota bacterium]